YPNVNETNFKVWKEVVVIVLDCMDLDLTLRITFKRLKLRNENALTECVLIMKRSIPKVFRALFLRVKVQGNSLKKFSNFLPKMKK
ncbi:hypothetical protein CR513_13794, partial [Mucuna pruriens]